VKEHANVIFSGVHQSQNAQRHRQTDRQTDNRMMPIADHTV